MKKGKRNLLIGLGVAAMITVGCYLHVQGQYNHFVVCKEGVRGAWA